MDNYKGRQGLIQILFVLGAVLLIGKAFQLQILDKDFQSIASNATISKNIVHPPRGMIFDRKDSLMVFNQPIYDITVTYNKIDPEMDVEKLCELLEIDTISFKERIEKDFNSPLFSKSVPFVFMDKVSFPKIAAFQERLYEFPGFQVEIRSTRGYPSASSAHILGYIREVNKAEVKNSKDTTKGTENTFQYLPGDYIGDSGLEKEYEEILRGTKGNEIILKDNLGRRVDDLYNNGDLDNAAIPGKDLSTTIDLSLQKYAELLMQNKRGGIVAIEPSSGEVLVMASSPTYDPNLLTISEDRGKAFAALSKDPNLPFHDRTVMAQYPPGSLFKPVVALIALQEEVSVPKRTIRCAGAYYLGGQRLTGCHAHPTCRSIEQALQHSCNAYFVTLFREIVDQNGIYNPGPGLEKFNQYLGQFGFGQKLGIDFPREQPGFIPSPAYYDTVVYKNESSWRSLWIRSLGIGQGELLMTTLQMANLAAIIGNRGEYITPHLVKGYRGEQRKPPLFGGKQPNTSTITVGIDQSHFEHVIHGMELAVTSGTARSGYIRNISFCGKTGTAENNQITGEDHSIFMGFAPKENPKIAIAVFIENAGFGGTYATPIASLIVEKYLNGNIEGNNRQWLERRMLNANLLIVDPETKTD